MRRVGMILAGTFGLMVAYPLLAVGVYDFSRPDYALESSREVSSEIDPAGYRNWTEIHSYRFAGYSEGGFVVMLMGRQAAFDVSRSLTPVFRPILQLVRLVNGDEYRTQDHSHHSTNPKFRGDMCG